VTIIQSLVRGRSVQNAIYDAKQARTDLIVELKSTHALWSRTRVARTQEEKAIRDAQLEKLLDTSKVGVAAADSHCTLRGKGNPFICLYMLSFTHSTQVMIYPMRPEIIENNSKSNQYSVV
jgi:hypothetical protein